MRQAEGGHLLHGISVKGCAKTPFKVGLIKSMPSASSYAMRNALCALHYSGVEDVMLNCFMQWPRERQDQRAKTGTTAHVHCRSVWRYAIAKFLIARPAIIVHSNFFGG